jgi:tRNA(Ile)-lysidine synthase
MSLGELCVGAGSTMTEPPALITELFRRALSDFEMLSSGDKVLVAVSGGQDSVALLGLLGELPPGSCGGLVVAHYNHGLRAEADAEEEFVAQLAAGMGYEAITDRGDVGRYADEEGLNLEAAARELRYDFLQEAAKQTGCNSIAVGHTASDVAETLLMNLLRGAGLDGLASISPVHGEIIRPLVYLSRRQTAEYCRARGLDFCTDASNADTENYQRNHIRHHLLPALERDYGPGVEQALLRMALAARSELEWTESHVRSALGNSRSDEDAPVALRVSAAAELPVGLLNRVLRMAMSDAGLDVRALRWEHQEGMAKLIYGEAGRAQIDLPGGLIARRQYDTFVVEKASQRREKAAAAFEIRLNIPGETKLPDGRSVIIVIHEAAPTHLPDADAHEAVLDARAAGPQLSVRTLRPGDRFIPLGMAGTRKVSELLIDEKVPVEDRPTVAAIVDADDKILWLPGLRIAQAAAISDQTRAYYYLRVSD